MSSVIIEEQRGTTSGRRHSSNGYYKFTGPVVSVLSRIPESSPRRAPSAFPPGQAW